MISEPDSIHVRTDLLTNRQVILATERSLRPVQLQARENREPTTDDPFLKGNESSTPQERLALRRLGSPADSEDWLLRVVPNRYPAVSETGQSRSSQLTEATQAVLAGQHDVIIECSDHRTSLTQLSAVEVSRVLVAWQNRCQKITDEGQFQFVNIFRNEGFGAGASLPHCHSQLVASNLESHVLKSRLAADSEFRNNRNDSLFWHWLNCELRDELRIVVQTQSFVIVCPYASRFPRQLRICPQDVANQEFSNLSLQQLCELGTALLNAVDGLRTLASDVAFNITLTLPPLNNSAAFPWMLDLLPRPSRFAGFELLTDIDILTVSPEQAAKQYRCVVNWKTPCDAKQICPEGFAWTSLKHLA